MLIGSKSISEMTDSELLAAIEELQSNREALRSENIRKSREAEAKGAPQPRVRSAPRESTQSEAKQNSAAWLAFLKSDDKC
jgi:hypothetical protein